MSTEQQKNLSSPIVREYLIGDTTYIVKATVKDGAIEDAVSKVRRLIRSDIKKQGEKNSP